MKYIQILQEELDELSCCEEDRDRAREIIDIAYDAIRGLRLMRNLAPDVDPDFNMCLDDTLEDWITSYAVLMENAEAVESEIREELSNPHGSYEDQVRSQYYGSKL